MTCSNALSKHIKVISCLEDFRNDLRNDKNEQNVLYYHGQRCPTVHHTCLRIGCSKLNFDICQTFYVTDHQNCSCGNPKEDAYHFFMKCSNFSSLRLDLFNRISVYSVVNLKIILYGNPKLDNNKNKFIVDAVHSFISCSKRFNWTSPLPLATTGWPPSPIVSIIP